MSGKTYPVDAYGVKMLAGLPVKLSAPGCCPAPELKKGQSRLRTCLELA